MARQKNDGKGRIGGRGKGTPNKATKTIRGWLQLLIDANREQIEKDLTVLEPKDRLIMLEKLMQYVIPKQQAVTADVTLEQLTDEQINSLIVELTKDI